LVELNIQSRYRNYRKELEFSSLSFDAFWAIAIALNNSIDPLKKENKTLDAKSARKRVREEFKKVDFEGIGVSYSSKFKVQIY
jgi:hypothetical protein